jgi:ferredoxin
MIQNQGGIAVKVSIDRELCTECGICVDTCPDLFELVDGYAARITEKYRTGDISQGEVFGDMITCADEAADYCPEDIIHIYE